MGVKVHFKYLKTVRCGTEMLIGTVIPFWIFRTICEYGTADTEFLLKCSRFRFCLPRIIVLKIVFYALPIMYIANWFLHICLSPMIRYLFSKNTHKCIETVIIRWDLIRLMNKHLTLSLICSNITHRQSHTTNIGTHSQYAHANKVGTIA